MKYARIENGLVAEIIDSVITIDGREVPLAERYHPDFIAQLVAYDPANPHELPTAPAATVEQRIAALLRHVDARLNAGAATRRYDSIVTASLRAGYPGPFHDEGVAFATWMDATYARCYEILAQWKAGEIEEPTAAELIAMLPVLELP